MNKDRLNKFSNKTIKNIKSASKTDQDLDYEQKVVKHKHALREERFDHFFSLCCHGLTVVIGIVILFIIMVICKIWQNQSWSKPLLEAAEFAMTVLLSAVGGVFIRERLERRVK